MEVINGPLHVAFAMDDATCVGEARRFAAVLAARADLDEVQAGRVALIVTELGNNLVRHAQRGRLLMAVREAGAEVEIVSMDHGPGIADVARCMGDGYSTGGTPGTGLGAVRRLARDFEIHSAVTEGTIIVARVGPAAARATAPPHAVCAAGLSLAFAGEIVCGDGWAVGLNGTLAAVMVADGLGHGPDAAQAAVAAMEVFAQEPLADPAVLLQRAHAHLRGTRGAAVSVLHLDSTAGTIRSTGAGNVSARVVSGNSDRTLLTQHGTVGLNIRRPQEAQLSWPEHALLVVHSDGLESRWQAQRLMPVLNRDPMLAAAILMRDHCRGRDDATVVVLRRAH